MSEDRTTYLGSHSASGLLGVSPWSGRHDVYMEALGIQSKPPKKEEFQFWFGKRMEPVIKDCYERMTGKKLVAEQAFFRSSEYPFMACHVDSLVLRDDVPYSTNHPYQDVDPKQIAERGYEAKTAHPMYAREWGDADDAVPQSYYLQCQHNMIITGLRVWDLAVSIGTFFKIYPIQYDPTISAVIIDTASKAWKEIQQLRKLIASEDPTDKRIASERLFQIAQKDEEAKKQIVTAIWPRPTLHEEPVPEQHYGLFVQMMETNQNLKAEEGNWEELANKLRLAMGEWERWTGPGGVVEWRAWGQSRRFLVKPDAEHKA